MCNFVMEVDTDAGHTGSIKSNKMKVKKDKTKPSKLQQDNSKMTQDTGKDTEAKKLARAEKNARKKAKNRERKKLRKVMMIEQKEKEKKSSNGVPKQNKFSEAVATPGVKRKRSPKKSHKGHTVQFNGKLSKKFRTIYQEEENFIANVMKRVPKLGHRESDENIDEYLRESDSDDEIEIEIKKEDKISKNKELEKEQISTDDDEDEAEAENDEASEEEDNAEKKRSEFLQRIQELKNKNFSDNSEDLSRKELKARLDSKIEAIRKSKERTSTKPKKKKKNKSTDKDKKMQFISKPNPNVSSSKTGKSNATIKDDTNSISSTSSIELKTPVRKNQVVKSNGQVVYSKFDFISDDKYYNTKQYTERKVAPKPADLLKKVEKHEKKISKLETSGKTSEAVAITDQVKWATAMKRAMGEKVRDDPTLLRKTIKKETKLKDDKRKKWKERLDHVEKQKQKVQEKRQTNIQQRKDEKKKRAKKLQRKRGRIA